MQTLLPQEHGVDGQKQRISLAGKSRVSSGVRTSIPLRNIKMTNEAGITGDPTVQIESSGTWAPGWRSQVLAQVIISGS